MFTQVVHKRRELIDLAAHVDFATVVVERFDMKVLLHMSKYYKEVTWSVDSRYLNGQPICSQRRQCEENDDLVNKLELAEFTES